MQVASLELCRALFELSRWKGGSFAEYLDYCYQGGELRRSVEAEYWVDNMIPAYGLSYLLRKLEAIDDGFRYAVFTQNDWQPAWHANRTNATNVMQQTEAATPEDAAAKLCIELIKQGVILPS